MIINHQTQKLPIVDYFPQADQPGNVTQGINASLSAKIAEQSPLLKQDQLQKIVEQHHRFLAGGGAGGQWKTILVKGLVIGIYNGPDIKTGQQANFERRILVDGASMDEVELPFSCWCGSIAPKLSARGIELSYSLLTDAHLTDADFSQSRLCNSDFSRSNLRGANFQQADCSGVDFENCDLRGADFRGTRLLGARFPGSDLTGVIY